MPLVSGDNVSFAQAIAYFRQKLNLPTQSYRDMERAEHDWAFTVAGATSAQLLADLRGAVDKALATGTSIQEFRKDFDALVDRHGWTYNGGRAWRTETILQTNIRSAYAAGRYQQMTDPDTLKSRPYWQWRHRDSRNPRPLHQAWDGLVLPADDPWWEAHYPPCGYGCRCVVFALSDRDLERLGKSGPDQAPDDGSYSYTNPATGETRQIPNGVDPGWDYTPGKTKAQDRQHILSNVIGQLPEELRQQVQQASSQNSKRSPVEFVQAIYDEKSKQGLQQALSFAKSISLRDISPDQQNKFRASVGLINAMTQILTQESFRGVLDGQGVLQAVAMVKDKPAGNHLYVEYLATAPWNVLGKDERSVKGAGTALIKQIAQESIAKGYGGEIRLSALEISFEFYRRLGFTERGSTMVLTAEAAQLLLNPPGD